jgi:hypothetical protein
MSITIGAVGMMAIAGCGSSVNVDDGTGADSATDDDSGGTLPDGGVPPADSSPDATNADTRSDAPASDTKSSDTSSSDTSTAETSSGDTSSGADTAKEDAPACTAPMTTCGSRCVDESSDDGNCGSCGHACAGGTKCTSGICACPSSGLLCGGTCIDAATDPANCGGCGLACGAGAACTSGECACTSLITDVERSDGSIITCPGRVGHWYTYNDGSAAGTQFPASGGVFTPTAIPGGRGTSLHAARTTGSGFTTWGAGMGFHLNEGTLGTRLLYDASGHTGFSFWAKAAAPMSIWVDLPDVDTDPAGGVCAPAAKCNDHFGKTITLTTTWTLYTINFSELHQVGWGEVVTKGFDPMHMYAIEFLVGPSATFDVWVDDVSFVP